MFTLSILFLSISTTSVSFLTPAFVFSEFSCFNEEMKINQGIEQAQTGHNYYRPKGEFECVIYIFGKGYIWPSERDFFISSFTLK